MKFETAIVGPGFFEPRSTPNIVVLPLIFIVTAGEVTGWLGWCWCFLGGWARDWGAVCDRPFEGLKIFAPFFFLKILRIGEVETRKENREKADRTLGLSDPRSVGLIETGNAIGPLEEPTVVLEALLHPCGSSGAVMLGKGPD